MQLRNLWLIFVIILWRPELIESLTEKEYKLGHIVNELNDKLKSEWNLLVATEITNNFDGLLRITNVPKILVLADKIGDKYNVTQLHSHNMLTVVQVNKSEEEELSIKVNNILPFLHLTHILWIYNNATRTDLHKSAETHWSLGFVNTLYYTNGDLFTYNPIPKLIIEMVTSVREYSERTPIKDFQGYPLKLTVFHNAPNIYRYTDRNGKVQVTGTYWKPLEIFIKQYNFEMVCLNLPHTGLPIMRLITAMKANEIDIIPGTLQYWHGLDRSRVLDNINYYFVVPSPQPVSMMYYYYLPFRKGLWLFNIFLLILVSLVTQSLIAGQRKYYDNFFRAVLFVESWLLFQYHFILNGKTILQKTLTFSLIIYGFVSINFYMAKLSSILTVNVFATKIETLADIEATNLSLLVSNYTYNYLHSVFGMPSAISNNLQITDIVTYHKSLFALNTSYLYVLQQDKMEFILYQQKFLKTPLMHHIELVIYSHQKYYTPDPDAAVNTAASDDDYNVDDEHEDLEDITIVSNAAMNAGVHYSYIVAWLFVHIPLETFFCFNSTGRPPTDRLQETMCCFSCDDCLRLNPRAEMKVNMY
ncbi:uncharacterized protein LOC133332938 [Musca vetustissima]|uniref:uncharacterized protein LOC133332938 n=1 Tax=Musca vetustissima TaxID=27455 RepID=UPI002AB60B67|nr:uncharacterized protein LOC133332938 [Musca vetustissima]